MSEAWTCASNRKLNARLNRACTTATGNSVAPREIVYQQVAPRGFCRINAVKSSKILAPVQKC